MTRKVPPNRRQVIIASHMSVDKIALFRQHAAKIRFRADLSGIISLIHFTGLPYRRVHACCILVEIVAWHDHFSTFQRDGNLD